jgi:hypothetical protein
MEIFHVKSQIVIIVTACHEAKCVYACKRIILQVVLYGCVIPRRPGGCIRVSHQVRIYTVPNIANRVLCCRILKISTKKKSIID